MDPKMAQSIIWNETIDKQLFWIQKFIKALFLGPKIDEKIIFGFHDPEKKQQGNRGKAAIGRQQSSRRLACGKRALRDRNTTF